MKWFVAIWLLGMSLAQGAGLTFSEVRKPLEVGPESNTTSADFTFKNDTDQAVVIRKYKADCSCMSVEIKGAKLRYEPGESGVVRANFDVSAITGSVEKTAMLWLDQDSEEKPSVRLTVDLHIQELIKLEPKSVKWELNDKAQPQVIRIEVAQGQTIKLGDVKASNPMFKSELKVLEEGKRYELVVTPSQTTSPGLCVFRIETDSKYERYKTLQAFAVIRKSIAKSEP